MAVRAFLAAATTVTDDTVFAHANHIAPRSAIRCWVCVCMVVIGSWSAFGMAGFYRRAEIRRKTNSRTTVEDVHGSGGHGLLC